MRDRDFLIWLHKRLEYQYSENELYDYMQKLRGIIDKTPDEQDSPLIMVSLKELEDN